MTPEELKELSSIPGFPEAAMELIRLVGLEATAALITAWPGQEFPVPIHGRRRNKSGDRRFFQLAEVVGESKAEQMCRAAGGEYIDIPSCKNVIHQRRAAERRKNIREMFDRLTSGDDGCSSREAIFQIGVALKISSRTVEMALKRSD